MRIVHPNKEEFPVGTRILWEYQDAGAERDSSIKEYSPLDHLVTLVSHTGEKDITVEVADVFINAVLDPSGINAVSVREKPLANDPLIYPEPHKHPVNTRMLVSYTSLPYNAPERDVTVKAWNDDGSKVKLQVNVPGGILAWHNKNEILVHKVIEDISTIVVDNPFIVINPIDHPAGSRVRLKLDGNPNAFDAVVRGWVDETLVDLTTPEDIDGTAAWARKVDALTLVHNDSQKQSSDTIPKTQHRDEFLELVDEVKLLGRSLGYDVTVSF